MIDFWSDTIIFFDYFNNLVKDIYVDCDMDAIILKINQTGAACHEGYRSCFFRKLNTENEIDIDDLKEEDLEVVLERLVNPEDVY